ncbi:MAG: hypothetical protein ACK56I_11370, partial [bacterium]
RSGRGLARAFLTIGPGTRSDRGRPGRGAAGPAQPRGTHDSASLFRQAIQSAGRTTAEALRRQRRQHRRHIEATAVVPG